MGDVRDRDHRLAGRPARRGGGDAARDGRCRQRQLQQGWHRCGRCSGAAVGEPGADGDVLPQSRHGDCLRATIPRQASGNAGGNIVLKGRRDTVFADGEAARRKFTVRDGVAYGPGVADMKAGLTMICFVLAPFARCSGAQAPLVGRFTGDEEIGSPEGRLVIQAEARRARVVFNGEPGRVSDNVVSGRKGGVFMVVQIAGKAAHLGGNFTDGISVIGGDRGAQFHGGDASPN
jgi:glutamate carboxypeptidase